MIKVLSILSLLMYAVSATRYSDCDSNLSTLEQALFETGRNLLELNRVFYPPNFLSATFIRVNYAFIDEESGLDSHPNVTYIWAIGDVLFLQPPILFKFNSLFFYYTISERNELSLQLPVECLGLLNGSDSARSHNNDLHMLDVLTQQLKTYARFTTQENVERDTAIARAVRSDELYQKYYSGSNIDFVYIIAAASFGPISLIILVLLLNVAKASIRARRPVSRIMKSSLRNKNLVALVSLGVYVSIFILTLDILAVHHVRTSNHEYAAELSNRKPFNLVVLYFTLFCDLVACIVFLVVPSVLIVLKKIVCKYWQESCFNFDLSSTCCKKEDDADCVLLYFLIAPVICITSHLGYIILAWLNQPSRSTTTLILYYFLFSYMYLSFRTSYKIGYKLLKNKQKLSCCTGQSYSRLHPEENSGSQCNPSDNFQMQNVDSAGQRNPIEPSVNQRNPEGIEEEDEGAHNEENQLADAGPPEEGHSGSANNKPKGINVFVSLVTFLLGMIYLGVAVIFIMMVYLTPLASEDLFNYILNVIEFIIVVVSTQYAYKVFVAKRFSFKQGLKYIREILVSENIIKKNSEDNIVEECTNFFSKEILIPRVRRKTAPHPFSRPDMV